MSNRDDVPDPTLAVQLANDLRDAFGAVAAAPIPAEQRGSWQRRLLAITTLSKRDVMRATQQLERFMTDLRALHEANSNDV